MPRTKKKNNKISKKKSKIALSGGLNSKRKTHSASCGPREGKLPSYIDASFMDGVLKHDLPEPTQTYKQPQKLDSIPDAEDKHKMKPVLVKSKDLKKLTPEDIKLLEKLSIVDIPHISKNVAKKSESVILNLDSTYNTDLDESDFVYVNNLTVNITNQGDDEIKIDDLEDVFTKLSQYLPINFFEIVFSSDNITTVTFKKTGLIGDSLPIGNNKTLKFESA
jgi:hypothetical protein